MNPQAAQELLNLIMLDDFVARKQALDNWSRKWIATLHVEHIHDGTLPDELVSPHARAILLRSIFNELNKDEVSALFWGKLADNPHSLVCQMHVILQKPRDLDAGADATKKMLDMAKGGK